MNGMRFRSLDGLRGSMAVLVLYSHLIGSYFGWRPDRPLAGATLCVLFFFMLSGFVLSASHSKNEGFSYLLIRFARLWPLHFMTTISMLCIYIYNKRNGFYYSSEEVFTLDTVLKNILFLHGMILYKFKLLNEPSWSISLEFWCSLLIPYVFLKARLKIKLLLIPLLLFISYLCYPLKPPSNVLMAAICMLTGNVAYSVKDSSFIRSLSTSALFKPLACLCVIYCTAGIWTGFRGINAYLCLLSFIPLLFLDLTAEEFFVKRFFCSGIILFLGSVSFPLYLFHESVIVSGIVPKKLAFPLYSLSVLVISLAISYVYNEKIGNPLYRKLKTFISRKKSDI